MTALPTSLLHLRQDLYIAATAEANSTEHAANSKAWWVALNAAEEAGRVAAIADNVEAPKTDLGEDEDEWAGWTYETATGKVAYSARTHLMNGHGLPSCTSTTKRGWDSVEWESDYDHPADRCKACLRIAAAG